MRGTFVYRNIAASRRMTCAQSFTTAGGGIARAPLSAVLPLALLKKLAFSEDAGSARLDLSVVPFVASAHEIAFFDELRTNGHSQGIGGTYDPPNAYLKTIA